MIDFAAYRPVAVGVATFTGDFPQLTAAQRIRREVEAHMAANPNGCPHGVPWRYAMHCDACIAGIEDVDPGESNRTDAIDNWKPGDEEPF